MSHHIRFLREVCGRGLRHICCFSGDGSPFQRTFVRGESIEVDAICFDLGDPSLVTCYAEGDTLHRDYLSVPANSVLCDGYPMVHRRRISAKFDLSHVWRCADRVAFRE